MCAFAHMSFYVVSLFHPNRSIAAAMRQKKELCELIAFYKPRLIIHLVITNLESHSPAEVDVAHWRAVVPSIFLSETQVCVCLGACGCQQSIWFAGIVCVVAGRDIRAGKGPATQPDCTLRGNVWTTQWTACTVHLFGYLLIISCGCRCCFLRLFAAVPWQVTELLSARRRFLANMAGLMARRVRVRDLIDASLAAERATHIGEEQEVQVWGVVV